MLLIIPVCLSNFYRSTMVPLQLKILNICMLLYWRSAHSILPNHYQCSVKLVSGLYLLWKCTDFHDPYYTVLTCYRTIIMYLLLSIVICPSLSDVNDGAVTCSLGNDGVHPYEDTCSFTCNTGYELTGSNTRTCQSDGSWSGTQTICSRGW